MATLSWNEVSQSSDYQKLSPQDKLNAKNEYFDSVITPQLGNTDDPNEVKAHFLTDTASDVGDLESTIQTPNSLPPETPSVPEASVKPKAYDFNLAANKLNEYNANQNVEATKQFQEQQIQDTMAQHPTLSRQEALDMVTAKNRRQLAETAATGAAIMFGPEAEGIVAPALIGGTEAAGINLAGQAASGEPINMEDVANNALFGALLPYPLKKAGEYIGKGAQAIKGSLFDRPEGLKRLNEASNVIKTAEQNAKTDTTDALAARSQYEDLKAQHDDLAHKALNLGDEEAAAQYSALTPEVQAAKQTMDMLNAKANQSVTRNDSLQQSPLVQGIKQYGDEANALSILNEPEYWARVGTQTLNEMTNVPEIANGFNVQPTLTEKVASTINKTPLSEKIGLREAGLSDKRAQAAEQALTDIESVIPAYEEQVYGGYTSPSFESYLNQVKNNFSHIASGNSRAANRGFNDFSGLTDEMKEAGLSDSEINSLHALNTQGRIVQQFIDKAGKAKDTTGMNNIFNVLGRIGTMAGIGAKGAAMAGNPLGAIPAMAAAYAAKNAAGKYLTKQAGARLEDVLAATRGEYQAPARAYLDTNLPNVNLKPVTTGVALNAGLMTDQELEKRLKSEQAMRDLEAIQPIVQPISAPTPVAIVKAPETTPDTIRPTPTSSHPIGEKLYDSIAAAETGTMKNPWIRTTAGEGTSSAYGPVQLTATTAGNLAEQYKDILTKDEYDALKGVELQGKVMLHHENAHPTFGLGKGGVLGNNEAFKRYYRSGLVKVMEKMFHDKHDNNMKAFIQDWRGAEYKADPGYYAKVNSHFRNQ